HVDSYENDFSFFWDGSEEKAKMIEAIEDQRVRYVMEDSEEDEYLEFRIEKSELSNTTILFVSEFMDEDDVEDQRLFWDTQITRLKGRVGGAN
ncbi:START-like domain-containing protein, partial [Chitinophagales bacterium]|nr:START-like domain-containing protein [Chitinophagales bacterium]